MRTNIVFRTPLCVLVCLCLLLTSCSSTRKLTISGAPGTEIYLPEGECIGVVDDSGVAKIKLKVNKFNAYLLGKAQGSDLYVPFALDIKYKNSTPGQVIGVLGYTVGIVGLAEGIVFSALGDPAIGLPMLALGAVGIGVGAPLTAKNFGFDSENSFKYAESFTDNDMTFSTVPTRYEGPNKFRGKTTAAPVKNAAKQKKQELTPAANTTPKAEATDQQFKHTVAEGETLVGIAQQYGVTVADIIKANKLTGNSITAGQLLVIPL